MKIGYCSVCADIIHIGHIRFIRSCADTCDSLVVGVMTDEIIKKYKGENPIIPYEQRAEIIGSIKGVDAVFMQDTFEFPKKLKVNIIFDSMEHRRKGATILIERTPGISSTDIKKKIYESFNNRKRKI